MNNPDDKKKLIEMFTQKLNEYSSHFDNETQAQSKATCIKFFSELCHEAHSMFRMQMLLTRLHARINDPHLKIEQNIAYIVEHQVVLYVEAFIVQQKYSQPFIGNFESLLNHYINKELSQDTIVASPILDQLQVFKKNCIKLFSNTCREAMDMSHLYYLLISSFPAEMNTLAVGNFEKEIASLVAKHSLSTTGICAKIMAVTGKTHRQLSNEGEQLGRPQQPGPRIPQIYQGHMLRGFTHKLNEYPSPLDKDTLARSKDTCIALFSNTCREARDMVHLFELLQGRFLTEIQGNIEKDIAAFVKETALRPVYEVIEQVVRKPAAELSKLIHHQPPPLPPQVQQMQQVQSGISEADQKTIIESFKERWNQSIDRLSIDDKIDQATAEQSKQLCSDFLGKLCQQARDMVHLCRLIYDSFGEEVRKYLPLHVIKEAKNREKVAAILTARTLERVLSCIATLTRKSEAELLTLAFAPQVQEVQQMQKLQSGISEADQKTIIESFKERWNQSIDRLSIDDKIDQATAEQSKQLCSDFLGKLCQQARDMVHLCRLIYDSFGEEVRKYLPLHVIKEAKNREKVAAILTARTLERVLSCIATLTRKSEAELLTLAFAPQVQEVQQMQKLQSGISEADQKTIIEIFKAKLTASIIQNDVLPYTWGYREDSIYVCVAIFKQICQQANNLDELFSSLGFSTPDTSIDPLCKFLTELRPYTGQTPKKYYDGRRVGSEIFAKFAKVESGVIRQVIDDIQQKRLQSSQSQQFQFSQQAGWKFAEEPAVVPNVRPSDRIHEGSKIERKFAGELEPRQQVQPQPQSQAVPQVPSHAQPVEIRRMPEDKQKQLAEQFTQKLNEHIMQQTQQDFPDLTKICIGLFKDICSQATVDNLKALPKQFSAALAKSLHDLKLKPDFQNQFLGIVNAVLDDLSDGAEFGAENISAVLPDNTQPTVSLHAAMQATPLIWSIPPTSPRAVSPRVSPQAEGLNEALARQLSLAPTETEAMRLVNEEQGKARSTACTLHMRRASGDKDMPPS